MKISPEAKESCAPFCHALTEVERRGDEGKPVRTAADEPLLPIRRLQPQENTACSPTPVTVRGWESGQ